MAYHYHYHSFFGSILELLYHTMHVESKYFRYLQCVLVEFLLTCTHKQVPCYPHPCSIQSWKQDSCDESGLKSVPK